MDYTYDTASRLTGETRSDSSPYAITYTYDRAGNRTQQTRDGAATVWSVDAANRLTTIRRQGVPTSVDVPVTGTTDNPDARIFINGQFAVNPGRPTERWVAAVSLPEGEHTITVVAEDGLGNQRAVAVPVSVIDPSKRGFSYDLNGNLVEEKKVAMEESTRYAYDVLNRLTGVSSLRGGEAPEAISLATHSYDGEGKRVSWTESGVTTTYLYDGLLPVLERQGSSTTINVWGLSHGGGIGGLLVRYQPSASDPNRRFLFPLYDGSGNVLAWTDSTGAVVGTVTYTAFGEVLSQTGSAQAAGFSTKAFSSTTALCYFGAWYYRPDLGRWLTPDPLGMVDGPNLYAYVGNNPLSFIDPNGAWAKLLHAGTIKKLLSMRGKSLNKTIRSLERRIAEHEAAIKDPAQQLAIRHHEHEVRVFRAELELAKEEAKRRSLLGTLGAIGAVIGDLLDPFSAISGELSEDDVVDADFNGEPDWRWEWEPKKTI